MFDSLEKLKPQFSDVFDGESGADICSRFRELEKLLVHASTRVFWEFGLQIEGNQDGFPPPQDGSVPKLVRYAINYLKNLTIDNYNAPMAQVLRTEQLWKSGILSNPENDQDLLKGAVSNVMEAIQRNVESKKSRYKDKVLAQIFAMNTYWYIYMRTRNTELGKLLGEPYMKKRYRYAAEESAYLYQKQAWGSLVKLLDKEEIRRLNNKEGVGGVVKSKMEAFTTGFEEICRRHRSNYKIVSDADLREQIKDATLRFVLPAYTEFFDTYSSIFLQGKSYLPPESVEALLRQIFEGGDQGGADGKPRRDSED
ncbi:UNVERIFIED_CONTAM: Exocyst complex component EXO70B2 [Sesamum radiatum]|uniref:Exocyst subunit Exo70 family protein n=1 Tax=Sesamum radiatum TaxID=300843 RepID=A0AAW2SI20_SESRA